jgi:CBS domain-containing protein
MIPASHSRQETQQQRARVGLSPLVARLEEHMPQQQNPRNQAVRAGTSTTPVNSQLIEKGWTVLDAVERAIGNVTGVDMQRGTVEVDGRPAGFTTFEVPLTYVGKTSDHEVHLTKVIDAAVSATQSTPTFIDPPKPTTARSPSGAISSATTERASVATSTPSAQTSDPERPPLRIAMPNTGPVGSASGPSAVPHATSTPTDPRVTTIHADADHAESTSWSPTKMAFGGLALSGLAAAGYLIRQKMRRKSAFERIIDQISGLSGDYADLATTFAKERHPAWWGGLAAAALPLAAYYVWPSPPTAAHKTADQIDDLSEYLERQLSDLSHWLPVAGAVTADAVTGGVQRLQRSASQLPMPANWNRPASWSVSTEAALSAALIAVSGLAIYLARRSTHSAHTATIGEVMTRRPRTIQPNATVADAAALMRQMDIGGLPVCDGSRLIGMVTDRDITIRSAADGRDPHLTPVRDIMSSGVAWATETDPVEEAARIMREHRIRRLPIVDERHSLVGMVSLGDLAVDINDKQLSGEALEEISEPSKPDRT